MKIELERVAPGDIEKRSMEIITGELGDKILNPENEAVIKRVIHTTADFAFADTLQFTPHVVQDMVKLLRKGGVTFVTDTQMALAGINKAACQKLSCQTMCFMSDPEVAKEAKERGVTRAAISMETAARLPGPLIFAIGNAPTALVRLYELIEENRLTPALIIGVPVGFVNVVESKELILQSRVPSIVARGRRGGSNVAAAICNAFLYEAIQRKI
ncbi:MAG: precorrin-8X methylmutase [Angelakisella sp.]|nr:precorrin-8X methylmutase [Angelakisella sp.]